MGLCIEYVSLDGLPPMELVRDMVSERLKLRVELIQHPAGFHIEVREKWPIRLVPSAHALEVETHSLDLSKPLEQNPNYMLLCRALVALGGTAGPPELLEWNRFKHRFEFQKGAPSSLEVHEQIRSLGGGDGGLPTPYEPWFELVAPLPVLQGVTLIPEPPWLMLMAGTNSFELVDQTYDVLVSCGARPRTESDW
ncbi:hypothetical protein [Myxococcus hansupus]|uniref:hypothetical protein n=1 Tax=Pseudomyxococcus hansupus TaxID=1297742 RepID=UPI0005D122B1|nr:hypothetical protein [Myxococcus hansupus]